MVRSNPWSVAAGFAAGARHEAATILIAALLVLLLGLLAVVLPGPVVSPPSVEAAAPGRSGHPLASPTVAPTRVPPAPAPTH